MLHPNLMHLVSQRTITAPIVFVGIGLHSGRRVTMRLHPAGADHGISLRRRDLPVNEQLFRVRWQDVADTKLCTTLGNSARQQVATVEHLLSALSALGVDNLAIELDGPEFPVLDGSAMPFVEAICSVGFDDLGAPREAIVIRRPVRLQQGGSWAELLPALTQRVTVSIDFNEQAIGMQSMSFELNPSIYRDEIAPARTFGFAEQIMQLRRQGLALGGSIKNAILLRDGRVENLEGLRFPDEFVRHKVLDVIGDLSLVGAPIIGHYRGHRPGHRLNTELLQLLMQDTDAWEQIPVAELDSAGVSEEPFETANSRRISGRAQRPAWRRADRPTGARPLTERILRLFSDGSP